MDGAIIVDKPESWTSHDVVGKMRRIARTKKIGHLGTLDPMATGVLPLVIGRATRLAQFYTRSDKVYEGIVRFGWSTTTYDREGEPTSAPQEVRIDGEMLNRALEKFRGTVMQAPPPVSAKKIDGRRAYELARKSVAVELPPVAVEIHELVVLGLSGPDVRIRAHCSGGTYMRSIAHDLGRELGCGAHLHELRRLSSGEFEIDQARTIVQLESLATEERLLDLLVPPARMLPRFPQVFVDEVTAGQIRNGRNFAASPFRSPSASRYIKAVDRAGELIAIGEAVLPNLYHPVLVM
jgi:tRNA pseudouridine55 synthase